MDNYFCYFICSQLIDLEIKENEKIIITTINSTNNVNNSYIDFEHENEISNNTKLNKNKKAKKKNKRIKGNNTNNLSKAKLDCQNNTNIEIINKINKDESNYRLKKDNSNSNNIISIVKKKADVRYFVPFKKELEKQFKIEANLDINTNYNTNSTKKESKSIDSIDLNIKKINLVQNSKYCNDDKSNESIEKKININTNISNNNIIVCKKCDNLNFKKDNFSSNRICSHSKNKFVEYKNISNENNRIFDIKDTIKMQTQIELDIRIKKIINDINLNKSYIKPIKLDLFNLFLSIINKVNNLNINVVKYGSFLTDLDTEYSDIDIRININDDYLNCNYNNDYINKIQQTLINSNIFVIKKHIPNAKVPVIKIVS